MRRRRCRPIPAPFPRLTESQVENRHISHIRSILYQSAKSKSTCQGQMSQAGGAPNGSARIRSPRYRFLTADRSTAQGTGVRSPNEPAGVSGLILMIMDFEMNRAWLDATAQARHRREGKK
jgi:hypothetical protein